MKRRVCLILAMLLLSFSLAVPVFAAEDVVSIGGGVYYDMDNGRFLYYLDPAGNVVIRSNVADGMVTNKTVNLRSAEAAALEVYLDGNLVENVTDGNYYLPGEYVVMYMGGSVAQRVFSFTIVSEVSNKVKSYALPAGFEVTEVTLNGEPQNFEKTYVKMTEEGQYDIHYRCAKTDIPYQLTVTTDYTGPELALAAVENGAARGPVDISDAKQVPVVNIYRDGQQISRKEVLTESGEYRIELADEAGNQTVYNFTILIYFDGNSWLFFLVMLGSAIAVVVYLMHSRKHLRVR